jgi:hypothetical protein
MATGDYSDRGLDAGAGERTLAPIPQPAVRGTRIRWDGALKALGIGVAAIVALIALPGLLAGEPPPPPEDVGLVTPPPPAPPPAPAPPPQAPLKGAKAKAEKPKPATPKPARPKPAKRRRRPRAERGEADPGVPTVAAAPSYLPAAALRERFGFER